MLRVAPLRSYVPVKTAGTLAAEVTPVQSVGPLNFEVGEMTRQLQRDYDDLVNRRANF